MSKSSFKNDRLPACPSELRRPIAQAQERRQQLSSLQVLVEAPRIDFSLPVLPSSDGTALQAHPPPDEDGEENRERPVRRPRTTVPDVNAVPVDGSVVMLSDQVEERGRRRDSWDRVKRRLRSGLDLLRALFFVQVQDECVCLRLRGSIQPRVRQWSMSWRALWRTSRPVGTTVDAALAELQACLPAKLGRGPVRAETGGGAGGTLGTHSSRSG
jgi:hypothetical protein